MKINNHESNVIESIVLCKILMECLKSIIIFDKLSHIYTHSLITTMQLSQERMMKESDSLNSRFQKLQQDFEAQLVACDTLNNENQGKASDLKVSYFESKKYYYYNV